MVYSIQCLSLASVSVLCRWLWRSHCQSLKSIHNKYLHTVFMLYHALKLHLLTLKLAPFLSPLITKFKITLPQPQT